jgi:hypothetical protein
MRTKLLLLLLLVGTINCFAQNAGDYRSKNLGPTIYSWNLASSWEVWNGFSWVAATNYPGQIAGSYNVEIVDNHFISNPNTPNSFGVLTINGTLSLSGNGNPTYLLSASGVIVTPGAGLGYIDFVDNCTLALPTNSYISVFSGGLSVASPCSASKIIKIGTANFATCNGGGQGDPVDFPTLTLGGGSINANITISPYQCFNDSVILTGSSSGSAVGTTISYVWKVTAPNGSVTNPTGNIITIPLLLNGVYTIDLTYTANYTATNTNVVNTETVKITSAVSTWNGLAWSPSAPDNTRRAIISSGTYNTSTNGSFIACSLVINSGAFVTIAPETYIETEHHVTNNGTLNIQNSGSLVQKDNSATFSGNNITVTRTTRPAKSNDYVYWGSPVQENVFSQIPADFDVKLKWNLTGNFSGSWVNLASNSVVNGEGFAARVKNIPLYNAPGTPITFNFIGKPNTGTVTIPAARVNVYGDTQADKLLATGNTVFLANPYPSAISAASLVTNPTNKDARKMGTLYFWTSVAGYNNSNGQYSQNDYASWNISGTALPPGTASSNTSLIPSGNIASGQGFFAQVFIDGDVVFNNSMRIRDNNAQFFRMAEGTSEATTIETELERHRIWVNLSNGTDAYRQMLVGYIEGATNAFDYQYDGATFTTNEIDIYTLLDANALSIQGRALPFETTDVIPLGYRITNPGIYTITLGAMDGLFEGNQEVYLKDKVTNTYHNLKKEPFQFNAQKGTFNDRFELRFTDQSKESNPIVSETNFQIYTLDQSIIVNSPDANIQSIEVYDLLGKLIYGKQNVQAPTMTTAAINVAHPFLIVKVTLANQQVITKKMILN